MEKEERKKNIRVNGERKRLCRFKGSILNGNIKRDKRNGQKRGYTEEGKSL